MVVIFVMPAEMKKRFRRFGFLWKPSSVIIHTHRRYCINTGWMTDGDRSREVEVRCKQENRPEYLTCKYIEWLNNKTQYHAEIISNNNYIKVQSQKGSLCQLVCHFSKVV